MHLEFDPLLFAHKPFMCLAFYGAESANQREVSLDEATRLHDSCRSVAEEQNIWLVIRIRHFNPLHVIKNTDYSVTSSLAGVHHLLHFYLFLVEFAMSIVEIL